MHRTTNDFSPIDECSAPKDDATLVNFLTQYLVQILLSALERIANKIHILKQQKT